MVVDSMIKRRKRKTRAKTRSKRRGQDKRKRKRSSRGGAVQLDSQILTTASPLSPASKMYKEEANIKR
jgi:hypothetical protein